MIYNNGEYIKARRIELGLTQRELAEGLCTTVTLSRIEQNKENPQDFILKSILQRLGLSGSAILFATTGSELIYNQLKFDIRQAYILEDYKKAEKILSDNKELISKLPPADKQTFETIDILLKINKSELSDEEALSLLEAAIRLTCPKYTKDNPPEFLTYEEILLLNNIALRYAHLCDLDTAIKLLYHIKSFYGRQVCDIEEALRTEPMVLYNLSKYLGRAGRIEESIEISSLGIRLAKETRRCSSLARTLYNKAYVLYERNNPGDREASLHYAKQAYNLADILDMKKSKEHYRKFILDRFNVNFDYC